MRAGQEMIAGMRKPPSNNSGLFSP